MLYPKGEGKGRLFPCILRERGRVGWFLCMKGEGKGRLFPCILSERGRVG